MLITFNTVLTETLTFSFKHYVQKVLKKTVTTEKYDLDLWNHHYINYAKKFKDT